MCGPRVLAAVPLDLGALPPGLRACLPRRAAPCPVSTGRGTRRVQLVRKGGERGGASSCRKSHRESFTCPRVPHRVGPPRAPRAPRRMALDHSK